MRRPQFLLLAALPLLAACGLTIDGTRAGVPVTLASSVDAPAQGAAFTVKTHAVYGLWGLATLREPSVANTLRSQLVGAKEVRDVRIQMHSGISDVIVTVLTLGLIVPRSVRVDGVVVGGPASATPAAPPPAAAAPAPGAAVPAPR